MDKKDKVAKEDTTFRWCEKREQKVAITVCRAMASKKKYCTKCLGEYDQLPLFPGMK